MTATQDLTLAKKHLKAENYSRAKRLAERALHSDPAKAEGHEILGSIEVLRMRPAYAIPHLKDSLDLQENDASVWNKLGWCYQATNQNQKAVDAFTQALKLEPGFYEALAGIGICLLPLGKFKAAQKNLEAAIAISDAQLEPYLMLATFTPKGKSKAFLKKMLALAGTVSDALPKEQAMLQFAIARAYDHQGDKKNFIKHLASANRLQMVNAPAWYPANRLVCDRSKKIFTPELLKATNPPSAKRFTPIFIVGLLRSGTTLLEQILASHSKIFGADELQLLRKCLVEDPMRDRNRIYPSFVPTLSEEELLNMAGQYQTKVGALAPDYGYITDKMGGNSFFIGMIKKVMPWAKVIHIRRHPCDAAFSMYSRWFDTTNPFANDLGEMAKYFRLNFELMEHWRKVLPGFILEIKYEDLVYDLEGSARKVFKFCGLEWEKQCLDFHRTERPVRTLSGTQVREKLYTSSIGRWREYERDLQPFISGIEDLIEPYGYPWPDKG